MPTSRIARVYRDGGNVIVQWGDKTAMTFESLAELRRWARTWRRDQELCDKMAVDELLKDAADFATFRAAAQGKRFTIDLDLAEKVTVDNG